MKTNVHILKMKDVTLAMFFLLFLVIITGCDLLSSDKKDKTEEELFNGVSFITTGNAQLPAIAISGGGQAMSIISEIDDKQPTGAIFSDASGKSLVVYADQNGFPRRVTSSNYIYIFDSFDANQNKVDIGVISPSGDIQILRKIEYDQSIYNNLSKNFTEPGSPAAWKFASAALHTASTVISLTGTDNFAGTLKSSTILAVGIAVTDSDGQALKASASGITKVASSFGCSENDLAGCTSMMTNLSSSHYNSSKSKIESKSDQISVTEGALDTGFGDVQVTLTWDTAVDLDLWVTDPDGEKIYYGNDQSATGGRLDRDDVEGFGPENIFWESGMAPTGEYKVEVDYYSGGLLTNYTVLVQAFGNVKTFTGQISPDETKYITTFSHTAIPGEVINQVVNESSKVVTDRKKSRTKS